MSATKGTTTAEVQKAVLDHLEGPQEIQEMTRTAIAVMRVALAEVRTAQDLLGPLRALRVALLPPHQPKQAERVYLQVPQTVQTGVQTVVQAQDHQLP